MQWLEMIMEIYKSFASDFVQTVCLLSFQNYGSFKSCIISSFSSVSATIDNCYFAFSLTKGSFMGESLVVDDSFRIAILEQGQEEIAIHFVLNRDDTADFNVKSVWQGCIAYLDGTVFQKLDVGNSFLYVCKVKTIEKNKTMARPLTYFRKKYESV